MRSRYVAYARKELLYLRKTLARESRRLRHAAAVKAWARNLKTSAFYRRMEAARVTTQERLSLSPPSFKMAKRWNITKPQNSKRTKKVNGNSYRENPTLTK